VKRPLLGGFFIYIAKVLRSLMSFNRACLEKLITKKPKLIGVKENEKTL